MGLSHKQPEVTSEFTIHLTQKTPQNQEVQIFVFTLRTLVKLPRPSRHAELQSHQVSEGCDFTEGMCALPLLQWWHW